MLPNHLEIVIKSLFAQLKKDLTKPTILTLEAAAPSKENVLEIIQNHLAIAIKNHTALLKENRTVLILAIQKGAILSKKIHFLANVLIKKHSVRVKAQPINWAVRGEKIQFRARITMG